VDLWDLCEPPPGWNPKVQVDPQRYHINCMAIPAGLQRPACNWAFPALYSEWTLH
jgi:hypothetical protein